MELRAYLAELSADEQMKFAEACGTSLGHLRNIIGEFRTCAEKLAIAIERETQGKVRCEDVRPDVDWAFIRGTSRTRKPQAARA